MYYHLKIPFLSLLFVLICTGSMRAQTYAGNVTGQLSWVRAATADTFLLEDIQLELIADGQGVVASTVTGPDGFFDFSVASFTGPDPTIELRIRVWAINGDTSIMARNNTNTGARKRMILTAGQAVWAAGAPTLDVGLVESPSDCRAQSVHFANKAKVFVESELAGSFAFPTDPGKAFYIMSPPFGVNQNFFMPDDIVAQINGILIAGGGVPIGIIGLAAALANTPPAIFTQFTLHPAVYLNDEENPGSIYHEFGHYLMWNLQGEAWLSFTDAGLSFHADEANDPSQKMAWTEGFADAFGWIMVALERKITDRDLKAWDNPAMFHTGTDTLKDTTGTIINTAQVLTHGFAGENYVASFIYDLWDGPNNLILLGNPPIDSAGQYDDETLGSPLDGVELTLAQILQPLLNKSATLPPGTLPLGRFGQEDSLINNVVDYHDEILSIVNDCELGKDINRQSRTNFVHNLDVTITDPLAQLEFINTDIISYPTIVRTRRFKEIYNNPAFNIKELKHPDPVAYVLDVWGLRDSDDDYNVTDISDPGKPIELSDDLQIGLDPNDEATLHFNRFLNDNFQTPVNTWNAPQGILFPPAASHLDVDICANATFDVGDNGIVELGDSIEENTAVVRVKSGSTFILGGAFGSGRGPGKLVINDNCRLVIEEGATLIFNRDSEIYLKGQESVLEINGNWIIENNATFTFTGSGHLETSLPANTGSGNVTMSPNSHIAIDGKGKSEHLIWVVKNGTEVVLPALQPNMIFSLEDGIVHLEAGATMRIKDAALRLEDLRIHSPNPGQINGGIRCKGKLTSILRVNFEDGEYGFKANFGAPFSSTSALIGQCNFINCLTGLSTKEGSVQVTNGNFLDNFVGWEGENPDGLAGVTGCLFDGNQVGLKFTAPQTLPAPVLFCQTTTMSRGDTSIALSGWIMLQAQCLNIDDHEIAVNLNNGASANLSTGNNCSFQSNGPTWLFDEAFLPNLANGNNQYLSSSSQIFEGTVLNNPAVTNWNGNHWQATNNQFLLTSHQNMNLVSGPAKVMTGTGMSSFTVCGSAPKTNASSAENMTSLGTEVSIEAFPQPFGEALQLRIAGAEQALDANLQILDLQGKVVWQQKRKIANGDVTLKGVSELPSGIYFLKITATDLHHSIKLIRQ